MIEYIYICASVGLSHKYIILFNARPWNVTKFIHTVVVVAAMTVRKSTKHLTLEITLHVA